MQDKLEKFIQENRDEFDVPSPSPDLWDKINKENEVIVFNKASSRRFRFYALRIAAVILIAVISIVAYEQIGKYQEDSKLSSNEEMKIDPEIVELIEAEAYYGNQVSLKMKELETYTADFEDIREDVLNDFEDLDAAYSELANELGKDIYKQQMIESMIETYRMKISILEEVLMQFENWEEESASEIKGI